MFDGVPSPIIWIVLSLISGVLLLLISNWLTEKQRYYAFIARWIIIPYLGLIGGSLSPTLIGLTNIDRLVSMGLGIGLVFAVIGLLILVRISIPVPATPHTGVEIESSNVHLRSLSGRIAFDWEWNIRAVLIAGAEEFQWVFLRGAVWEMLLFWPTLTNLPAYTAVWCAAALALPEAIFRVGDGWSRLLQLVTLTTTSILFFYTRNFWLCFIAHAAILLIFPSSISRPQCGEGEPFRKKGVL